MNIVICVWCEKIMATTNEKTHQGFSHQQLAWTASPFVPYSYPCHAVRMHGLLNFHFYHLSSLLMMSREYANISKQRHERNHYLIIDPWTIINPWWRSTHKTKCPFGICLFRWNWKLFAESTVDKGKS